MYANKTYKYSSRLLIGITFLVSILSSILFTSSSSAQVAPLYQFAIIGDYGVDSPWMADVATMIDGWNPDFIITTGDNNYPDGEASTIDDNVGKYFSNYIGNYIGAYGSGSATNRFFPAMGGHDTRTGNGQPFRDYFTLPGNERYYDFVEGSIHFFVLNSDTGEPDGADVNTVQYDWLQAKMAASTSQWNIVYLHHAPYTSSDTHSSEPRVQWPFQAWGADLVVSGHAHQYERLNVGGLTYIVNGAGGRVRYGFDTPLPESIVRFDDEYGAQLVSVYECEIVAEFYSRSNGGTLIDSVTIRDQPCNVTVTNTPQPQRTRSPTNNNAPTAVPPVIELFDPAISKIGFLTPGQVGVTGEQLEWIITVNNPSAVVGQNVLITDTLDNRLQVDSVSALGAQVTINGQNVSVLYPTIGAGQSIQFSIFTTVLDGANISNIACVRADNQDGIECANGFAVSQLPVTGETPQWVTWSFLIFGVLIMLLKTWGKVYFD